MILARYVALNIFKSGGLVLLLLLALFSFLSLSEALEDVGEGSFSTEDAIATVVLTTPKRLVELLPVAALLGSVLGLGTMANQRELIALRASGVSAWRLARTLALIATGLALIAVLTLLYIAPVAERRAQEFRANTLEQTQLGGAEFWSRRGNRVIRVGSVDYGRIPRQIEIYELDNDGRLLRFLSADRATLLSPENWLLASVQEKVLGEGQVFARQLNELPWASFLTPDQVSTLITPAHALSAIDLHRYLKESADSGLDTRQHQVLFWRQVSLPLSIFAMVLLGLPLVINSVRTRSAGYRVLIGAGIGIGFYLFEQITGQLALLLELPPAATSLSPALLVLAASLIAIHSSA